MTTKEMIATYPIDQQIWTFERMLESSLRMHKLDPLTFKWCPFLEDQTQLTEDAFCIFEQLVAIEKGWA